MRSWKKPLNLSEFHSLCWKTREYVWYGAWDIECWDVSNHHLETTCFGNALLSEISSLEGREGQDILSLILKLRTGPGVNIVLVKRIKAGTQLWFLRFRWFSLLLEVGSWINYWAIALWLSKAKGIDFQRAKSLHNNVNGLSWTSMMEVGRVDRVTPLLKHFL